MGYFGKQIYNEPMSMYVDPKLDILANSLGAVQKRHDENYAQMGALDIMAHNIKVAPGDKAVKDAALGKLKAQRDAIASTGQYAYAMPQIGAATSDFMGNEDLNWSKDQEVKRQEAKKRLAELGTAGLDFNRETENWSSFDPVTGERREYTNRVEKQEDYDANAQQVMKLMASERPIALQPSHVRDYLMHGSVEGISATDVANYINKGYDRFLNGTTAGKQMFNKLTKILGQTDAEAEKNIKLFLNNVGDAQVHEKLKEDYTVNSALLQRDQMAQQERHWQAEHQLAKDKLKAEQDEAAAKAGKAGIASPAVFNQEARRTATANGFGAMTNTDILEKEGHQLAETNIGTPEVPIKVKGLPVTGGFLSIGEAYNSKTGNFNFDEIQDAETYFNYAENVSKTNKKLAELNNKIKVSNELLAEKRYAGADIPFWSFTSPNDPRRPTPGRPGLTKEKIETNLATWNAEKKRLEQELNTTRKKKEGYTTEDIDRFNQYKEAVGGQNAEIQKSISNTIDRLNAVVVPAQDGKPNDVEVDGRRIIRGKAKVKGSEISKNFTDTQIEFLRKNGSLNSDEPAINGTSGKFKGLLNGSWFSTDGLDPDAYYDIDMYVPANNDATTMRTFDAATLTGGDYGANSMFLGQTYEASQQASAAKKSIHELYRNNPEAAEQTKANIDAQLKPVLEEIKAGTFKGDKEVVKKGLKLSEGLGKYNSLSTRDRQEILDLQLELGIR